MPLVQRAAPLVETVESVIGPDRVAETEYGVGGRSLPIVDFVGPCVGGLPLEATGESLLKRRSQGVIPTADAVGQFVDGPESRVRPRTRINLRTGSRPERQK
jgi:hypothetical protein